MIYHMKLSKKNRNTPPRCRSILLPRNTMMKKREKLPIVNICGRLFFVIFGKFYEVKNKQIKSFKCSLVVKK